MSRHRPAASNPSKARPRPTNDGSDAIQASHDASQTLSQVLKSVDREARFSQLLQPIQDLTKNWNIDIAAELEDYMNEIENISISFDGGFTALNFAEAALLIQGSACIYSKKVEYLYALVYQVLELVANRKRLAQKQSSSLHPDGNDADAPLAHDDDEFLDLDDIKVSSNIDLPEDPDDLNGTTTTPLLSKQGTLAHDRSATSNPAHSLLLQRTPLALVPLAEQEKDNVTLYAPNGDVLGSRCDFRMNTSLIHSSGALLLDLGEKFKVDMLSRSQMTASVLTQGEVASVSESGGSAESFDALPDKPLAGDDANYNHSGGDAGGGFYDDYGDSPDYDDDDDNDSGPLDPFSTQPSDASGSRSAGQGLFGAAPENGEESAVTVNLRAPSARLAAAAAAIKSGSVAAFAKIIDPWIPLDPHEQTSSQDKPFRKGKTFKLPASLKRQSQSGVLQPSGSIGEFCSRIKSSARPLPASKLKGIAFADFDYLYWEEQKRRDAQKKSDKQRLMVSLLSTPKGRALVRENGWEAVEQPFMDVEPEDADSIAHDLAQQNSGSAESSAAGPSGSSYYDDYDDDGGYYDDDDVGPLAVSSSPLKPAGSAADSEPAPITLSYEELVDQHIKKFLKSAQDYAQETALSKRVSEWEEKIRPVLEEQDIRPAFDIHVTGKALLSNFKSIPEAAEQPVSFEEVVADCPVYQVCRMFVSCLQLANQGNVRISRDETNPDTGMRVQFIHGDAVYKFNEESDSAAPAPATDKENPPRTGAAGGRAKQPSKTGKAAAVRPLKASQQNVALA